MRWVTTLIFILLIVQGYALIFMVPTFDMDNPIIEVYAQVSEEGTEVTVIFLDEDHPNPIVDFIYDIFRFFKYGRVKDVETFFIFENEVYFPGVYASTTSFFETENLHHTKRVGIENFEIYDGETIIYVNTWNHMFCEKPLPGIPYVPVVVNSFLIGSREDVEKIHSWHH